jgi:low temperature requirement protein LtrA
MVARSTTEEHRASTPLELFFDLCFVVAVSQAAAQLHHALGEGHLRSGILGYLLVFFAIWWAWMNFTWFSSSYDTDDILYRATTLVQMAGVLVLAAGVPRAFTRHDFTVAVIGYSIMRIPMISQWLRAAHDDPERRPTTIRYAIGIAVVQICWLGRLALPGTLGLVGFGVLVLAELAVPVWAERHVMTSWHPEHINERYGLFTIIVLGESILGASNAVQSGIDAGHSTAKVLTIAAGGVLTVFTMWWLYFDQPADRLLEARRSSILASVTWGYSHIFVFGTAAAVGAGFEGAIAQATGEAPHLSSRNAGLGIAVPLALYLVSVWALHVLPVYRGAAARSAHPIAAALIVIAALIDLPILAIGLLATALLAAWLTMSPTPAFPPDDLHDRREDRRG